MGWLKRNMRVCFHPTQVQSRAELKRLDIDSGAQGTGQLSCPADLMGDSAKMDLWLHHTVLAHIAANGGNVPKELLD